MIRPPFLTAPRDWINSVRIGHDRIRYASPIEVGHRPFWWWLWRMFR